MLCLWGWPSPIQGYGIQIGAATVTPEVSAGVETSTNVYRLKNQQIPAAGVLIAPRLGVESLGSTSQVRLSASISRTQWLLDFGDQPVYDIWRISRTDAGLDLDLVVMPTKLVGFVVSEQVSRQNKVQPSAIPGANGRGLVTRTDSLSNLGLRVAPGPALAIDLGWATAAAPSPPAPRSRRWPACWRGPRSCGAPSWVPT